MVCFLSSFEAEMKELRDCQRAQQLDAAENPAALAASSHRDGGQAAFHGHVLGEGSSELADNMGGGSGDKGATKDLPGGSSSGIGSRQVGSSEGGSDTEAVDGSDADDETDSKPKPPRRRHTWSPYDKLLVVLAWLTDTSVGWPELVRRMKASMFKDRFKGDSWDLDEKNVRDWVKAGAARQERARSIALQESAGTQAQEEVCIKVGRQLSELCAQDLTCPASPV
jgi:hypothetical protein